MDEQDKFAWVPVKPWTFPQLLPKLWEIVTTKPVGYTYNRAHTASVCLYWHKGEDSGSGEPGCIIGHLLAALGVPNEIIQSCDHVGGTTSTGIGQLIDSGQLKGLFDERATPALAKLQSGQDSGTSWSEAVAVASAYWDGMVYAERRITRVLEKMSLNG